MSSYISWDHPVSYTDYYFSFDIFQSTNVTVSIQQSTLDITTYETMYWTFVFSIQLKDTKQYFTTYSNILQKLRPLMKPTSTCVANKMKNRENILNFSLSSCQNYLGGGCVCVYWGLCESKLLILEDKDIHSRC